MSVESSPTVRIAERYSLRERIAVGGMGEVHLATDDRLGRLVAVKVLAAGFADSPDFVERFRREALTAAALSHPNIAQVYDYGVDGDSHFIVMEYAEGQDLAQVIREHGRLTPGDAVRIAEQVCAALGAAHRAGVVHRDVKPGNVIVRSDGTVKVTDFGIARARGQASLTDTGTVMGTAAYVAPEQARGEATTPSSDLYSLGILLFQMLTGSVPFEGDTPVAIAMRHLDEPVPLPSSRVADLPANLDEVVVRATAKSPADRYADADAMAAALVGHEMRADAATRALPAGEATSVLDLGSDSTAASTAMMPTVGLPSSGERTVVHPVPPGVRRGDRLDPAGPARAGHDPALERGEPPSPRPEPGRLGAPRRRRGARGDPRLHPAVGFGRAHDRRSWHAPIGDVPEADARPVHDRPTVRRQHRPRRPRRPAARRRGQRADRARRRRALGARALDAARRCGHGQLPRRGPAHDEGADRRPRRQPRTRP
nr:protein kinase [Terrabacter sp. Ter38]